MTAEWFYLKNGQNVGPFTQDQLRQLARQGQLLPTDLVWKNGMPSWSPASSIPGLLPSAPPPQAPAAEEPAAPSLDRNYEQILKQGSREMLAELGQAWRRLSMGARLAIILGGVLLLILIVIWIVVSSRAPVT
jgi:hypothetical protein